MNENKLKKLTFEQEIQIHCTNLNIFIESLVAKQT